MPTDRRTDGRTDGQTDMRVEQIHMHMHECAGMHIHPGFFVASSCLQKQASESETVVADAKCCLGSGLLRTLCAEFKKPQTLHCRSTLS